MHLNKEDKLLILRLIEDKINELHTVFLDIANNSNPAVFKKNTDGIMSLIKEQISVLEKVSSDLNVKADYDWEWYKLLLQSYNNWLVSKPRKRTFFSRFFKTVY